MEKWNREKACKNGWKKHRGDGTSSVHMYVVSHLKLALFSTCILGRASASGGRNAFFSLSLFIAVGATTRHYVCMSNHTCSIIVAHDMRCIPRRRE